VTGFKQEGKVAYVYAQVAVVCVRRDHSSFIAVEKVFGGAEIDFSANLIILQARTSAICFTQSYIKHFTHSV